LPAYPTLSAANSGDQIHKRIDPTVRKLNVYCSGTAHMKIALAYYFAIFSKSAMDPGDGTGL
jgi:hypothetical protein